MDNTDTPVLMTNIIQFPKQIKQVKTKAADCQKLPKSIKFRIVFKCILAFIQTSLILLWPFIRWFVYLDLLVYFLKMLLHTNSYATFELLLHCFVILSGVLFVFLYKAESTKNDMTEKPISH